MSSVGSRRRTELLRSVRWCHGGGRLDSSFVSRAGSVSGVLALERIFGGSSIVCFFFFFFVLREGLTSLLLLHVLKQRQSLQSLLRNRHLQLRVHMDPFPQLQQRDSSSGLVLLLRNGSS